jgi:hypothetical protein
MQSAASQIEATFYQRRIWEEEYLARIEAIVREELDFYKEPLPVPSEPPSAHPVDCLGDCCICSCGRRKHPTKTCRMAKRDEERARR